MYWQPSRNDIIPCTQRLRNQGVSIIMTPPPPFLLFGFYYTLYRVDNLSDLARENLAFTKQSKSEEERSSPSFDRESAEHGMCTFRDHHFSFPVPVGIPFSVRIQLLKAFVDNWFPYTVCHVYFPTGIAIKHFFLVSEIINMRYKSC